MNRLERKCLLGSAAMHGLLVAIFVFGSAFFTPKAPRNTLPPINFIPNKLVDQMLYGGGNPNVSPQAQPPPAPKPLPEAKPPPPPAQPAKTEKPPEPVKPKETAKPKEQEPKPLGDEPVPTKSKTKDLTNKPHSSHLTNVVAKMPDREAEHRRAEKQARLRAEKEAQQAYDRYQKQLAQAASAAGQAVSGLGTRLSGETVSIEVYGPGGYAFANYDQWVKSVYDRAWEVSDDIADDNSTVKARVTIARDGAIISARIIVPSPNRALNKSVQDALDAVKTIGYSFPDGAKEDQRTFTINFNLKAKRQLG